MQKLFIDGKFIGYVKEFHQNRERMSWTFSLATIDTESKKYTLQVEIGFEKIKFFHGSNYALVIETFNQEDEAQ